MPFTTSHVTKQMLWYAFVLDHTKGNKRDMQNLPQDSAKLEATDLKTNIVNIQGL